MSAPDPGGRDGHEFERLLAAHANRELTRDERMRLEELAQRVPGRAAVCTGIDHLHGLLDRERDLAELAAAPMDPIEEIGETWTRLNLAASVASESLRAKLRHNDRPLFRPRRRRVSPRLVLAAAALAVVAIGIWAFAERGSALLPQTPSDRTLGGGLVLVPELSAAAPRLEWHAVANAVRYRVVVTDLAGNVVLERPDGAARSTHWDLTAEEFASLERAAPVTLRVVALDGDAIPVLSSGELRLQLRR